MTWPDIAIALANILFSYSIINQIIQGFKHKIGFIHFGTAILTVIGAFVMTISLLYLGLVISALVNLLNAVLWAILTIQRIIYKKA
jgi:hypothetical protein